MSWLQSLGRLTKQEVQEDVYMSPGFSTAAEWDNQWRQQGVSIQGPAVCTSPCRLTLPAGDKQEDVDVEPDTADKMSTATQRDKTNRPFSRHWDGPQPDIAAQDGHDWWNHLQEASAEQLSHVAWPENSACSTLCCSMQDIRLHKQHVQRCLVFLQSEELDNTIDSDVVEDFLREVNRCMHV